MNNVPAPHLSIAEIMNPRSVAVIGGSEDLRKFGARVLNNTIQGGFSGRIVPVNPKRDTVFGLAAVPKVSALDEPVDVAVIAVPRGLVLDQLKDCAASGVGCCVLITAGFTETGEDGARLQDEINTVARDAGMRLIGPNCLGLINTHAKLIMNSSPSMELTDHEPGGIGFISQSGALMATVYNRGVCDGARFSSTVSVGNQADLELADFMEWMADDPATRVITLYVEGFKNPGRFVAAAKRCRDAGKPVLMVKAGRSEEGARVAMSHTASLAGSWRVLQAVCRDAGVIAVDDTVAMMQTAEMFSRHGHPKGDGILVMSGSGGAAAITSDLFADRGLRLAAFSTQTHKALEEIYEPVQLGNPLDIGATRAKDFVSVDDSGLSIAAADPDVSANLLVIATAPQLTKSTEILAKSGKVSGKPTVVVFVPGNASDEGRQIVRDMGVLGYETIDEALRVLQGWMTPSSAGPEPARPDGLPTGDPFAGIADGMVDEHRVKQVLARYGVPVTRETPAASIEEAMTAAEGIGYPVALKGFGPDLIHKSDEGAVVLNLSGHAALETAWQAMTASLGVRLDGCLVSEMADGIEEVILGIKHDDQFGPMVLVGLGGVLAEIIDDVVLLPAPVAPEHVKSLMGGLRLWPVFDGARGRPKLDVDAIADAAARLSWLAVDAGERLRELDINPLLVRAHGQGAIAVDARARLET